MEFTRREIISYGSLLCLSTMLGCARKADYPLSVTEKEFEIFNAPYSPYPLYFPDAKPVVSIVRLNEKLSDAKAVEYAVTKALDLVGAHVMGFETDEIDTFKWAFKAGMKPTRLDDIQVVGEELSAVRRPFEKPHVVPYSMLNDWYGPPC